MKGSKICVSQEQLVSDNQTKITFRGPNRAVMHIWITMYHKADTAHESVNYIIEGTRFHPKTVMEVPENEFLTNWKSSDTSLLEILPQNNLRLIRSPNIASWTTSWLWFDSKFLNGSQDHWRFKLSHQCFRNSKIMLKANSHLRHLL